MSLPMIPPIPVELPIDIPILLHPAIVHFAIAIPIVIILLEFINLFFKKRALSVFSLFLIFVLAIVMVGAYFTGGADGKEAFSLLSEAGKSDLKAHKLLGTYLAYGSVILLVLKLLFMLMSNFIARFFFLIIVIGFTAVTLKQGHDGGDLVYKYGTNSEAVANVLSDKDDLKDELDDLQEKYDELKESSSAKKEEVKEEPKAKEPKVEEKKEDNATAVTSDAPKEEAKEEQTSADANKSK
ncbi:MAG: hypothetical protein KAU90_09410 [Sulfurovaceae bacterium]|nr:hypothetical protein [Sulfurovaceae bacterium]